MNEDTKQIFNAEQIPDSMFNNMVKRRRAEASGHWNKDKKLDSVRSENVREYLGKYVEDQLVDDRYQEIYVDNRQFTSVRTIVPFLTARVTASEVTPAGGDDLSIQFAKDFEEALQKHAEKQMARAKIRLAVQDVLKGKRVGILKWRYNAALDTVVLDYVKPESVVIGKRSGLFEEPDYLGHTLERSIGDLITQFPDKADKIRELFAVQKGVPSQLERIVDINEDWLWVDLDGKKELVVGWNYQNFTFGKTKDPNWNENGKNLIDQPMIPYVFFNFLNDGTGYIDETSYLEQAKWLQRNYNKRGQTIAENAKYGGIGVPIFAKGSIPQKDVAKIRFSPIHRILLDAPDVSKAFTTWQSQNLPQFIVEDKYDDRNSIDNIWGTPNIFRGEQSKNNTLGQDVLIRDQAEGRLGDPVDCIDDSMTRFYLLEGQMMYRYFTDQKFYNYLGNDGKFVSIVVSRKEIAKNLGISISVKASTSLPIDRAQKRKMIFELLKLNRVGTLTAYKELGIFDDPEEAFKQFITEQADPQSALGDVDKRVFDREANQDLQLVIAGKIPDEREDLSEEYLNHLNEYLLTDKYKMLKPEQQARVSQYIDAVIQKSDRKAAKLSMQPAPNAMGGMAGGQPIPPQVQALMQQQGGQPGQPPQTPPQAPPMAGAMPNVPPVV